MRLLRWLRRTVCVLLLLLTTGAAHATTIACTFISMDSLTPNVAATTLGRDVPVGSTTQPYPTTLNFSCPGDPCCDRDIFVTFAAMPNTLVAGYTDVYPTNVTGVGVRFTISNGAGTSCSNLPFNLANGSTKITCHQFATAASPGYNYAVVISAIFVKTGAVASGTITTIPSITATNTINNQAGSTLWGNAFPGTASGSFTTLACSVKNPVVQVNMPRAFVKNLSSVGATTGATPFNVSLDCDAGIRVAVTLTDVTTPANRSTTLTLTPDSSASGIGFQISFQGTPIAYGLDTITAGNPNQIFVSSTPTTAGAFSVPLNIS